MPNFSDKLDRPPRSDASSAEAKFARDWGKTRQALITVFLALVIGNLLVLAFIYRLSVSQAQSAAYQQLQAIADFKTEAIHRWRQTKLHFADAFTEADAAASPLRAVLDGSASELKRKLALAALERHARTHLDREVLLVSAAGQPLLSTGGTSTLDASTRQLITGFGRRENSVMGAVYRSAKGEPMSDLVTPMFDPQQNIRGYVVSRFNLKSSLETIVSQWLGDSTSGEATVLLADTANPLRLTAMRRDAPAAAFLPEITDDPALRRAARTTSTESFEDQDFRQQIVLVASRRIPETDWILVTKIDLVEVLSGPRRQLGFLIAGSLMLIALCGLSVLRLWRIQGEREKSRWVEARERQEEVEFLKDRLIEAQRFGKMGSWERDLATGDIWWSQGMYALYGVDRNNVPKNIRDVMPFIHPDDRESFMAATTAPVAENDRGVFEFRALDVDGKPRHVRHQWRRIYDSNGKAVRLVGTTQDISERVENEAALREQLDMLKTLIENVPGGVTLFDRELRLRFYNRQYQTLLDFPDDLFKEEHPSYESLVRYNAWRGEFGPGDPEKLAAAAVARASEQKFRHYERTRPDGSSIEIRSAPLKDGGFVTIYTDITARKKAEQRQLLSEKIIATSPTAILITNPRNQIVFVNPAFTTITGYTPNEVLGTDPKTLSSGRHDAAFYEAFWDALQRNDYWAGEIWDRKKDGSVYPKWLSVHVLRDANGRLTNYVAMFTDITERKQAEERIHHLAHHDPLTGLGNRLSLEAKLEVAIADAARYGRSVALLFIDLDRFKTVNDSLGHAVGDLMLMEVAQRLTERLRASDVVARLGGDEFVVVLPDLPDAPHAGLVAQSLLDDLAKPIQAQSNELHTSGSIGIAIYPADGSTVETLMRSADTAMYEAKSAGRNAFRFFTRAMTESANERLQLENDLRAALLRRQFELHYQPQVSPIDGRIVGVEALLRWRHQGKGMIGPDRFIPIAEETGLIVEIGAWVIGEGCRQARRWIDAGYAIRMAINLSARQLRSEQLLPLIRETLAECQLPPHTLELEITESALMERPDQAIAILRSIKEMGVALALDDFGTGYSSLAYLKRFPIDRLKIDRSFVRDLETDPNDRAIALSTIALAHSMGLQVTAEGVEEAGQRDFLRDNGCDDAQGWFYSKAVPAEAATALLLRAYLP